MSIARLVVHKVQTTSRHVDSVDLVQQVVQLFVRQVIRYGDGIRESILDEDVVDLQDVVVALEAQGLLFGIDWLGHDADDWSPLGRRALLWVDARGCLV